MSQKKTKVLYIEDDKNQRQFLTEKLQQRGYKISTSSYGSAGIRKVTSLKPDVILCDLNLPDLSRIQVLNHVKKSNANVPVIILTAHGSIPLAVKAIREGAYDFIIKPFQIDEIETTIRKALETKLLQKELRQSEANLQMLMENVPDVIYSLNPKGELISLSPAVKTILEYEPAELIGTSVFKIIHKDDRERVREGFIKATQSGQEQVRTVEFRMTTKSGEVKYFEVKRRYLVKDGKVYKSDGIARDVTKRKHLEDELKKYSLGLEQKTRELEKQTYLLANANVDLLAIQEQLEQKNEQMEALLKELQKSRDEMQIIMDTNPDVILMVGNEGKVVTLNNRIRDLFGIEREDIENKSFENFLEKIRDCFEDFDQFLRAMMEDIERNPEKYINNKNENMKRNGERVWITWANKPIFDEAGNVKEILSIGKDITDRKKAVEELTRAHRIYREAIENVEGVPYLKDYVENKYNFIGEGIKNLLEISASEFTPDRMRQLPIESFVTDPKAPADPVEYGKAFLKGEVNHYRVDLKIKMPGGEEKWVSDCSVPIRDENTGQVTGSLGILQDITDRKRVEDRLRLYRKIFINSNDGIAIYNPEGALMEQNSAHQNFFEYSDASIRGKTADLIMGDVATQKIVQQLQATGSFRGEITSVKKSGDHIDIDLSIFPILNEANEITSFAGIGRDITERKKAEALMATRLRYEEGLAACSQALLSETGTERALTEAMQYLLQASNTSRVYIFVNFDDPKDGLCIRQTHEVCAPASRRKLTILFCNMSPINQDLSDGIKH